jgi:hypothetical protein
MMHLPMLKNQHNHSYKRVINLYKPINHSLKGSSWELGT